MSQRDILKILENHPDELFTSKDLARIMNQATNNILKQMKQLNNFYKDIELSRRESFCKKGKFVFVICKIKREVKR